VRTYFLLALGLSVAAAPLLGCDDSPEDTGSSSSSGTGGSGTGGTTSGTGGTTSGTGGGVSGGGGTTSSGTGGAGGEADFWEGAPAYDASGEPNPSDGEHNAGMNCMSCHASNSDLWLFGGTVYESGGSTGAANVQVGAIVDGTLYTTYSASNGNFWVDHPGGTPDWSGAEVRFRNANGETAMVGAAAAACNSCHTGSETLIEP
jgi:hypothetical protein